MKNLVKSNNRL